MGYIRKRSDRPKRWLAGYRGPKGRVVTKAFRRKVDADRWLATQETDRLRGMWADPRSGQVRFGEQAERWMAGRHGRRPTTLARDDSVLRSLVLSSFGELPLAAIAIEAIESWIGRLVKSGYSPSTVHKAYEIVSGVLKSAVRARRLAINPATGVSLPKVERIERRFLTAEEIFTLAEAIHASYRLMVLFGWLCWAPFR